MESRSRLAVIIAAIVAGSLLTFCAGIVFTLAVIMPARGETGLAEPSPYEPTVRASPSQLIGPGPTKTPVEPRPTATYAIIILTPASTTEPTATSTLVRSPAPPASPSPRPGLPFHYVEGTRDEEENCVRQYLQGWVYDANGASLNGVTVRWDRWGESFFEITGDPQKAWRPGEWKFTYGYGQASFDPHVATEFVLQIVQSAGNPTPLSEPLTIHYAGCGTTGQITNIVFKRR